jgi:hypothetical protein
MKQIIELLKAHKEDFELYERNYSRNLPLLAVVFEEKEIPKEAKQQSGWETAISYFSYYRLSALEMQIKADPHNYSISICGVTFVNDQLLYFATARMFATKMIAKQKNFDDCYRNEKIRVFEKEEDFAKFLLENKEWWGFNLPESEIAKNMEIFINDGLYFKVPTGKSQNYQIENGILQISPIGSLVENM